LAYFPFLLIEISLQSPQIEFLTKKKMSSISHEKEDAPNHQSGY